MFEQFKINPEIKNILEVAIVLAKKVGNLQKNFINEAYETKLKDLNDIVTDIDIACENEILSTIKSHFPEHSFKSEEAGASENKGEWEWVIDPLDGTINYSSRLPFYTVSLAVQKNGVTEVGVIYAVEFDELYVAIKDIGAFMNNNRIKVSNKIELGKSVLTFMFTSNYSNENRDRILSLVSLLSPHLRGFRLLVSQAFELSLIASGRLDGHVCIKSRGFSGAAGVLLLREAGGKVTDLIGNEFDNNSRSMIASNGIIHESILNIIKG